MEGDRKVTVEVSVELLAELGEWSEPLEVRVEDTPGFGTGWEMTLRRPEAK